MESAERVLGILDDFCVINAEGRQKYNELRCDADRMASCVAVYIARVYFTLDEETHEQLRRSSIARQGDGATTYFRSLSDFFDGVEVDSEVTKDLRYFDERMFHEEWFAIHQNSVYRKVNEVLESLGVDILITFQEISAILIN